MIDNTEFSIHKFDTKIFEVIYDLQYNKVLHTNKDGEFIITYLKYSINTSEIKAISSFKTDFNNSDVKNAKFFSIESFSDNILVKDKTEIILIEKDENYIIYELFIGTDKNKEILFELAKKNLNKILGYNKIYLMDRSKLYFLFFEVNYSFMVFESNSKCIEISDKKVMLYALSFIENTLFLSILYESNLLEIYQYTTEIANTANISKFKKILELVIIIVILEPYV